MGGQLNENMNVRIRQGNVNLEGHVDEGDPCDFLLRPIYRVWNESRCITFQDKSVNITTNIAFTKNKKENKFTKCKYNHQHCIYKEQKRKQIYKA
jgi:hypothetical protein